MDKETVLLIFPDTDDRRVLLMSNTGKIQVFEMPEGVAQEAFLQGLADVVGISLANATFDEALVDLSERLQPIEIEESGLRQFMVKAMFRFLMEKTHEHG